MNIIKFLRKINNFLTNKTNKYLSYEIQHGFLLKFPMPKNDIERSYFQYNCQCFVNETRFRVIIKNIISAILIPYFLFKIPNKINNRKSLMIENILIGNTQLVKLIPNIYNCDLICLELNDKMLLNKKDKIFIKNIAKKYPCSWYFILKSLLKVARYSYLIEYYKPRRMIVSCEYSFTSSILTYYCEQKNIIHINIMHGEKIYNIRDSFCRFHEFFIWDEYYRELFFSLKADKTKYIIFNPYLLKIYKIKENKFENEIDYKFYLAIETKESLSNLKNIVEILLKYDKKVLIRPHPIYTNQITLKKYFDTKMIEKNDIDILLSLSNANNIVAVGSTVLYHAYMLDKNIIIDDLTNKNRFYYFRNNKYIMFHKKYKLLSDIMKIYT